ncbi:SDR family NAD(P)-dependent oxidoreductase [Mucilaginibacter robiniae]|uniref:SDR family NAD(P)-dependent oxidoreductase n=1 Tax=Mucilaginibacter robiniae TaxID=2728022 RepID=A0A7L5E848_9SPHI|nr:SDR family NAD(P)-dependent oxidoreductase [Mucilaginibacter robiniae]QJD98024.1 SDR family NAD(P)-dependent oxidoreductase [Mucilaginibacter robiniae]
MELSHNTILITGGTSGIGLALAQEFKKRDNTVIICGRRADRLDEITLHHPGIITRVCDVADTAQREELVQWLVTNYPGTNVLINNAGIQLLTDLTNPCNLDRVRSEIETNLVAPVHLASLLVPHLRNQEDAAIINISSGLAFAPLSFMPIYCATKAAVHSVSLSLRHQLKDTPIKVYEIAPPAVDTELGHDRRDDKTQSHGGMPVDEFVKEAVEALQNNVYEVAVGQAENLRAKREQMFTVMNP